MKKNSLLVLSLALVASVGLAGCDSVSTPQDTVKSAYTALMKNNIKKFPKFLSGDAKDKYGNLAGMVDLQRLLLQYDDQDVGKVTLVATTTDQQGHDKLRKYTVEILGKADAATTFDVVLTADVDCTVERVPVQTSVGCVGASGPNWGPAYYGVHGAPWCHGGVVTYRDQVWCSISDIK